MIWGPVILLKCTALFVGQFLVKWVCVVVQNGVTVSDRIYSSSLKQDN
jgi:hypothetical protein